jgi:hypothetical protein
MALLKDPWAGPVLGAVAAFITHGWLCFPLETLLGSQSGR